LESWVSFLSADPSSSSVCCNRIAAMMAKLAGHVWSFDELFAAVLGQP
jgi:hypothetical protein